MSGGVISGRWYSKTVYMMWRVLDSVLRKLNTFWNEVEGFRQNKRGLISERLRGQDKLQTTTDESYDSCEDSGFADDEGLQCTSSDNVSSAQTRHRDSESDDCELNDNDFVLDCDLKNQQRITLMSLLYSRALERKLNGFRARKPSFVRKHK